MQVLFVMLLFLKDCLRQSNVCTFFKTQHASPSLPLLTPPTPRTHKSIRNNYESFDSQEKVTLRKKSTRMNRRSSKKTTKLQNTY